MLSVLEDTCEHHEQLSHNLSKGASHHAWCWYSFATFASPHREGHHSIVIGGLLCTFWPLSHANHPMTWSWSKCRRCVCGCPGRWHKWGGLSGLCHRKNPGLVIRWGATGDAWSIPWTETFCAEGTWNANMGSGYVSERLNDHCDMHKLP